MAIPAIRSMIKVGFFCATMIFVAKVVPYEGVINEFMHRYISLSLASSLTEGFLGETAPEPFDVVRDYIKIFTNTLISVPIFSALATTINYIRRKSKLAEHIRECLLSIVRRFVKIFLFLILFWVFFRFIPYGVLFTEDHVVSVLVTVLIISFNFIVTVFCYFMIVRRFIIKVDS